MDETGKNKRLPISALSIVALVLVVVVLSYTAFTRMRQGLFVERANNFNMLMEKITQNVETAMKTQWDMAQLVAGSITENGCDSLEELYSILDNAEKLIDEGDSYFFVIDDNGMCHTGGEKTFRWWDMLLLSAGEKRVSVATPTGLGVTQEHIFFLSPLPRTLEIGGQTFTHICLGRSMSAFDTYFDMTDYSEESMAFVIHANGTQVYKQKKNNELSSVYNMVAAMERFEYQFGGSAEQVKAEIAARTSNCLHVQFEGKGYFVAYCPVNVNDWTTVLIVPEGNVGQTTSKFVKTVAVSILAMAAIVLMLLVWLILRASRRIHRQQIQIHEKLVGVAEAERRANAAKTRFLSSMSHDIRTPMNAIIGMITLARHNLNDTVHVQECLDKIALASGHLLTLINDVLDISKVESGKMVLNPIDFSLAETATNLANVVRPQVLAKRQTFDMRIHNVTHEYLHADNLRVSQIFINLLTNAVKYTPEGGNVTVDIEESAVRGREDMIHLTYIVQDTGIGMSPEFLETMYESFSRAVDTRVNEIQGTGLGLTICKQMTELMGGSIHCESEINKGTKFTVEFDIPLADKERAPIQLPPMRVLVVDDDEHMLASAAESLKALGAQADCVESGQEALQRAANEAYQVIIVDWKMPQMNGFETIKALRGVVDASTRLLISAYDWSEVEGEARQAGAEGFISKPFFRTTVYRYLNELMRFDAEYEQIEEDTAEDLAGMSLLVAEDNDLNWEIIEEMMAIYSISAVRAVNGYECLENLRNSEEGRYDMVLMDVQMPVMNGIEAARAIRGSEVEWIRNIPVVAMTADAFAEDVRNCLDAGMNGHVAKPIDLNKLFAEMRKARKA